MEQLSWDRATLGESFCPGIERLQGVIPFLNGITPARVVILSRVGMTPAESFSPGMERLKRSPSILGWNDYRGVSEGGTTPGESIFPGMEQFWRSHSVLVKRLLGSPSDLGWNDPRGVILSLDRTTLGESFSPRK